MNKTESHRRVKFEIFKIEKKSFEHLVIDGNKTNSQILTIFLIFIIYNYIHYINIYVNICTIICKYSTIYLIVYIYKRLNKTSKIYSDL